MAAPTVTLFTTQDLSWATVPTSLAVPQIAPYMLPPTIALLQDDATSRFLSTQKLLADGEAINAYMTDARDITVTGDIWSADTVTQRTLLSTIAQQAARPNLCLAIEGDRYVNLARLKKFERKHHKLTRRSLTTATLTWRLADPYWYATTWAQQAFALSGNGSITVNVDSTIYRDVSPVIQITAPGSGSVPSVTLTNTTDGGRFMSYSDLNLASGAIATLDCRTAQATRGGSNGIRYVAGWWLRLLPGANVIQYAGAACTLTFTFLPRWQ